LNTREGFERAPIEAIMRGRKPKFQKEVIDALRRSDGTIYPAAGKKGLYLLMIIPLLSMGLISPVKGEERYNLMRFGYDFERPIGKDGSGVYVIFFDNGTFAAFEWHFSDGEQVLLAVPDQERYIIFSEDSPSSVYVEVGGAKVYSPYTEAVAKSFVVAPKVHGTFDPVKYDRLSIAGTSSAVIGRKGRVDNVGIHAPPPQPQGDGVKLSGGDPDFRLKIAGKAIHKGKLYENGFRITFAVSKSRRYRLRVWSVHSSLRVYLNDELVIPELKDGTYYIASDMRWRVGICMDNEQELCTQLFHFIEEIGLGLLEIDIGRYDYGRKHYENLDVELYTVVDEHATQSYEKTVKWLGKLYEKMPNVKGIFVYEPADLEINLCRTRWIKEASKEVYGREIEYGFLLYPWRMERFKRAVQELCESPVVDLIGHDDYGDIETIRQRTDILLEMCRRYGKKSFVYVPVGFVSSEVTEATFQYCIEHGVDLIFFWQFSHIYHSPYYGWFSRMLERYLQ